MTADGENLEVELSRHQQYRRMSFPISPDDTGATAAANAVAAVVSRLSARYDAAGS